MDIEKAISEIENEGLYGNQVHQETLELALAALEEKAERERIALMKQMTNADRIRSMTDAELAEKLLKLNVADEKWCKCKRICRERLENDELIPDEECMECVLNWLKQPWEEA